MSGDFRPEQNQTIESTDNEDLARHFGLTEFNRETGLWTGPKAPDAGQRDGEDVQQQRHAAARAEGDEQDEAERAKLDALGVGAPGQDVTESDERTPGAPNKAGAAAKKATGSKASQSKDDDGK